jgi:Thioredoxin like C-terminal domain
LGVVEQLANQLLGLPLPVDAPDTTPQPGLSPETYFGVGKMVNYAGSGVYDEGEANFAFPPSLPNDSFALQGPWTLDYQGATADSNTSSIELNYHAKNVYIVVGGAGSLTVTRDGKTTTLPVSGPPTSQQIVARNEVARGSLEVRPSEGLQVFSFTYG